MLNRRMFLVTGAAAALIPTSLLTGCDSTTVAEFVSLIGADASTLATYFGQTALAAQITSLSSQISIDITNFQSGAAATDAIEAINDLIGLIDSIPIAVPYAPLIVLLLSALTGLLAILPQSSMKATTREIVNRRNVTPTHYSDFGKKSMTNGKKNFVSSWNSLTINLPLAH